MDATRLIYLEGPDATYLREFDARVVASSGKDCVLDATAFYPEGGGQPHDTGRLITPSGRVVKVLRVFGRGKVRHVVGGDAPVVGERVHGILDWERRYTHMRMHTAQHLLSGSAYRLYGARTGSSQIHLDRSRLDLSPFRPRPGDVQELERACNEVVRSETPVTIRWEERSEFASRADALRTNLDLVPASVKRLRIVSIGEFDECPCAGTHVRNTREIGMVRITRCENKGAERMRVTFVLEPPPSP